MAALFCRRCHDADNTGIFGVIPLLIDVATYGAFCGVVTTGCWNLDVTAEVVAGWALLRIGAALLYCVSVVFIGFLTGTKGENRYGPAPDAS